MEGLNIFPKSVLTQNKRIAMMKNLVFIRNIKRIKNIYKKKFWKNKKKLYSKEDSEDDDDEISEDAKVLFMGFESENPEEEIEDVVDLEPEIINYHEELEKYKRMYKK